jgi:hypothetical protein
VISDGVCEIKDEIIVECVSACKGGGRRQRTGYWFKFF